MINNHSLPLFVLCFFHAPTSIGVYAIQPTPALHLSLIHVA
jgi:hypothetical protein